MNSDEIYIRNKRIVLRHQAINQLGGKCKVCSLKNRMVLQFHHIIQRYGEKESIDTLCQRIINGDQDILLLCSNCHIMLHQLIQKDEPTISAIVDALIFKLNRINNLLSKIENEIKLSDQNKNDNENYILIEKQNYDILISRSLGKSWREIAMELNSTKGKIYYLGEKLGIIPNDTNNNENEQKEEELISNEK